MYFLFLNYWSNFAFSQIRLSEGKIVPAVLLPHETKYTTLCHLQNLRRNCLLGISGKCTAGVILSLGESQCLDWSSEKDDALGFA